MPETSGPDDRGAPARFPASLAQLVDTTRCPSCFEPLATTTCSRCGLDLTDAAAGELADVSRRAGELLCERERIIAGMRARQERVAAASAPVAADSPVSVAVATSVPVPLPAAAATAPATTGPAAEPRRRLGPQVVLLLVGAALLAVAAVFFLVYAFVTFGIVWRSTIIAGVTVAAFVGAALLNRRSLRASSEAVAAVAVVLVCLDAYAARATGLLGLDRADGALYAGCFLALACVGFVLWWRGSSLRVASFAATLAAIAAAGYLVSALVETLAPGPATALVMIAASAAGVLPALLRLPRPERLTGAGVAAAALVVGVGSGLLAVPSDGLTSSLVLIAAGAAGLLHAVFPAQASVRAVAATATAVLVAAAPLPWIADAVDAALALPAAALWTAAVLAAAARLRPRLGLPAAVEIGSGAVAAIVAAGALLVLLATAVTALFELPYPWSAQPGDVLVPVEGVHWGAFGALAIALAVPALVWRRDGGDTRHRALLWIATGCLGFAPLLAATVGGVLVASAVLAVAAASLGLRLNERLTGSIRWAPTALAILSALAAFVIGWSSALLWWVGPAAVIIVCVLLGLSHRSGPVRAAVTVLGTAGVLAAGAGAGIRLSDAVLGAPVGRDALWSIAAVALAVLVASRLAEGRLPRPVSLTAAGTGAVALLAVGSLAWAPTRDGVLPEPPTGAVLAVATAVVASAWSRSADIRARHVELVALAPATGLAAASLAVVFELRLAAGTATVVAAALLVVAFALLSLHRPERRTADIGAGLTVAAAIGAVGFDGGGVLLLAAVAFGVMAATRNGLVDRETPRRHLIWVAFGLGAAALVEALLDARVELVEAYTLPTAAALLVLAGLSRRVGGPDDRAAGVILLAAVSVALLPSAVTAVDGSALRPALVLLAALTLLVLVVTGRLLRDGRVALVAGATVVLAVGGRAVLQAVGAPDSREADLWCWLLVAAAIVTGTVARRHRYPAAHLVVRTVGLVALATVLVVQGALIIPGDSGALRAVLAVGALSAVHLLDEVLERPLGDRAVRVGVPLVAAALALAALVREVADPFELVTLPLAVGLLGGGAARMLRDRTAGSPRELGPGLAMLLIPPLLGGFVAPELWRVVALGVLAVACVAVGAGLRLRAPLLFGGIVAVIHAFRTFAPQIRGLYESTEWWLWAAAGGALLLFLGITFERRRRDLAAAARAVAALR